MATITPTVSANVDDGHEWNGAWYPDGDTPPVMYVGAFSGIPLNIAIRVQVNLANTVTINSATLRIYAIGAQSGTPIVDIYGDDVDNSAEIGNSALPSDRTPTTATLQEVLTEGEWGSAGWVEIPVTSIVAEIIARSGWVANNYLTIVLEGNPGGGGGAYAGFEDYSSGDSNHAHIVIDYTEAGTPEADIEDSIGGGISEEVNISFPGHSTVENTVSGGITPEVTVSVPVTTDSIAVAANADDGCYNGSASGFTIADSFLGTGDFGDSTAFWVFRDVQIQPGALLTDASLDYFIGFYFNRPNLRFFAVDADTITTIDGSNILTAPRTTAYTDQNLSGLSAGGNSPNSWASDLAGAGAVTLTAAIQEVVNRPGWVIGNDIAILCEKNGGDGYAFVIANDFSDASNPAVLSYSVSTNPQISSVSTIRTDGAFTVTGYYLSGVTGATLTHVASGAVQAQTVTDASDTEVELVCVEGDVPPGPLLLTLTGTGADATYSVVKLPEFATYDWVVMDDPYTDTSSVGFGMSPALATDDIIEWQNAESGGGDISLLPSGVWGGGTITLRRWIASTGEWDAEGWITHTVELVDGAFIEPNVSGGITQSVSVQGTEVISDLAAMPSMVGTATGAIPVTKKIKITVANPVVNTQGQLITNVYDKWFITQSDIDQDNYNGVAIDVEDNGENLSIVAGVGEVSLDVSLATFSNYWLVAFNDNLTHYFRYYGTVVEE